MKKISLLLILISFVLVLSGCSLFSSQSKKDKFELQPPENISFREERTTLYWDSVKDATGYTVKIDIEKGETIYLDTAYNSCYLGSVPSGKINISVMAKKEEENKKSKYSEAITLDFIAPVDIDEKSLNSVYKQGILTVSWTAPNYAEGYVLTYQIGEGKQITVELDETEYKIEYSQSNLNCLLTLYAKGSGNHKNGKKIRYTHEGIPDFENPVATITVDFNQPTDALFPFAYIIEATLDGKDISSLIESSSKIFNIPVDYWKDFSLGLHDLVLVGLYEVKTFKLEIINSKTPELTIGNYVYDGDVLVGTLKCYGNTILGVCGFYDMLPKGQAEIIGDKVILYPYFLDKQPEGELRLNIAYKSPKSDAVRYLGFTIQISGDNAKINTFSYTYDGENDLVIDISTNGDKVTSLKSDGNFVPSYQYTTSQNELIIKKSFLDKKEYNTFLVSTLKGATLSFVVQYALNGFVPTYPLYSFDKCDSKDLVVDGVVKNSEIIILGNKITPTDYKLEKGKLYINGDYLKKLKGGTYEFAVFSGGVTSTFAVQVFASSGEIKNLKLDYDISQTEVFITFDCDCKDGEHYYKYNGNYVKCFSGDVVPNVNRLVSQTITLSCKVFSNEKTFTISPPSEAKEYLTKSYMVNGKERDLYIESTEELAEVLTFVSLGGNGIIVDKETPSGRSELTVFFSKAYLDYTKNNNKYFEEASYLAPVPYNCRFSLNGVGNKVTLSAKFTYNPNEIVSSGKQKESLSDIIDYLPRGNRTQTFNDFAINDYDKEDIIITVADLEMLPFGIRPVFLDKNSPASVLYEKALTICRTYISKKMNDFEKVMTFYHYLTTRVTYDTYALDLYNLRGQLINQSLEDAKANIYSALSNNGRLDKFLSPLLNLKSTDEIVKTLFEKVSQLSSFSAYGALVDGIAVCDGISSAMKLLCSIEGIECIEVSGLGLTKSGSQNHSWNKVKIEGKWFVVDATWGRNSGYVNHRYFMIDENDARNTHIENPDNVLNSVVETPATGQFDFFVWNIEPYTNSDMSVQSEYEFKNLVKTLRANGEKQFEIELDFAFEDVSTVIKNLNINCKYFVFDNIVLIIL